MRTGVGKVRRTGVGKEKDRLGERGGQRRGERGGQRRGKGEEDRRGERSGGQVWGKVRRTGVGKEEDSRGERRRQRDDSQLVCSGGKLLSSLWLGEISEKCGTDPAIVGTLTGDNRLLARLRSG
ncbi:hypothetical protein Pcinc_029234 [Petrolisthes cinctipes]|uniref:Uncharacterized protein n=1 Tax=Petrolisthes cinctipes TaxID=88211 RepID=A0AAE1F0R7_PETCI|nr:hypothetical protein Pcinc_029234 [Petrolisthes cinctipes]